MNQLIDLIGRELIFTVIYKIDLNQFPLSQLQAKFYF